MKRAVGVVVQAALLVGLATIAIGAQPAGAITLQSCSGSTLAGNDDGSTAAIPMAFGLNFFGHTYTSLYVNNNGNVTFNSPLSTFTPSPIGTGLGFPIIAPFWADVDTRPSTSQDVTYGTTTFGGRQAFCVSWPGVGFYNQKTTKLNDFQLLLVNRSDQHAGDFDIVFNYQQLQWEEGDFSGGQNGLSPANNPHPARAGYSDGQANGTSFEIPGSAVRGALLDTNHTTGLIYNNTPTAPAGEYVYPVRNGLTATHVSIETAADGSGGHVNAQNVASGSSVTAYAIARDANNAFVANVAGTWSLTGKTGGVLDSDLVPSGDGKSATFTGLTTGGAKVHVVNGAFTDDSGTLTVVPGPLSSIITSPDGATIAAGGSQAFTAEGFDANGNSRGDVTGATTFSIGPDGSCAGASCGATIAGDHTVTGTDGAASDDVTLHVTPGSLDSIALSPGDSTITAGGSQDYTAEGFDSHGNSLGDVTGDTSFSITPNGSCGGASCTASLAGSHTVTGTDGAASDTSTLHIITGPLHAIVVSPDGNAFTAGGSQAFTAEGFDIHGNSLGDVTGSTTFSIDPDGSCTGATCTATTAGTHTVTGTDSGFSDDASLGVNPGSLSSITISPDETSITAGGSQAYTAEGFDGYGNSLGDVTGATTFSIGPDGSCAGASCGATVAGDHTVTGTDGATTDDATLHVNVGPLDSIVVSPDGATVTAGDPQSFTAEGFDAHSNSLGDVTGDTSFSIGPNGSCVGASCTPSAAGDHTVTGTDGSASDHVTLHVDPIVVAPTLSLTKSDSPDPVEEQNPITYTMQVGNGGTQTANGVTLTDNLPAGTTFNQVTPDQGSCTHTTTTVTCTLGAIAGGGSTSVSLIVQAPDVTVTTVITNHASASASNAATTTASADTTVNVNAGGETQGQVPPDTQVPLTFTTGTQSSNGQTTVTTTDKTAVSVVVPPGGPGGSISLEELACPVAPCTGPLAALKDATVRNVQPAATGKLVLGGVVYNVIPPSGYSNSTPFKVVMLWDKTLGAKKSPVYYFKPGVTPTEITLAHCGQVPPNSGKPCVISNAQILTGPPSIRGDWKVAVRINSDPRMRK